MVSCTGSNDICFNALLLQCEIILVYSNHLEVSPQSLNGVPCAGCQEPGVSC